jgi:hypothetical protein
VFVPVYSRAAVTPTSNADADIAAIAIRDAIAIFFIFNFL